MHLPRALSATLLSALLAACGGSGSDAPGTTPPPTVTVSSVAISAASSGNLVSIGETRALTAVARDAGGTAISNPSLTWTSSAPSVAAITGSGGSVTVTAVGNGSAIITATSGSVQGTLPVTVAQVAATLTLSGATPAAIPGMLVQLAAQVRDARGNVAAGIGGTVTFASSDPAVVSVNPSGAAIAIAPGSANLTASLIQGASTITGTLPVAIAFATTQSVPTSASVAATNSNLFTPQTVSIATGGTVTWSFGSVLHNVAFSGSAGAPTNIGNTASSSVARTFANAGTFNYDCTLHPGMVGTVLVGGSNSAGPAFTALLSGANERPTPVMTTGNGAAAFTISGSTVSYVVTFSRLTGAPQAAHIHGAGSASQAAGVLVGFSTTAQANAAGVLTGSFTAADIRGQNGQPAISIDSLFVLMRNGNAYVNVHTAQFPGGEIRGQTVAR